jgi:hypothetical protein
MHRMGRLRPLAAAMVCVIATTMGAVAAPSALADPPSPAGQPGYFTFRSFGGASKTDLGVNVATGNLRLHEQDLVPSSASYWVDFARTYNSRASTSTDGLGPLWNVEVGPSVRFTVLGLTGTLHGPDGFDAVLTDDGTGHFTGPTGFDGDVQRQSDGSYLLTRPTAGDAYLFSSDGDLLERRDGSGRQFTVQYTSAAGQTILGSYGTDDGRRINISYNGDATIREIDDPASDHRYYDYTSGDLTSYSGPDGGESYDYSSGLLSTVTETDGTQVAVQSLADGRATAVTVTAPGQAAGTTSFDYEDHRTIVTGPDGHRTVYVYDDLGRVTSSYDDTTPPAEPDDFSLVYDPEEDQADFSLVNGDDPSPGSGTAGTEVRFKPPGAADFGPWLDLSDDDNDAFLVDAEVGDDVEVQASTYDAFGNFSPIEDETVTVQDSAGSSSSASSFAPMAASSGPACYTDGDSPFDFPYPAADDNRVAVSSSNLPDCRDAHRGTQDSPYFYESSNPGAHPYRPRKISGYANLGTVGKATPTAASTVHLQPNMSYGGRRVWPVYDSLNHVMAWIEEYLPSDGLSCTTTVAGACAHREWVIYDSDGNTTFDPSSDHELARNPEDALHYLSLQGRGCMESTREDYEVAFLRGSGYDTLGRGTIAKIRGFMRVAPTTSSGIPAGITHGSYDFHKTDGTSEKINFTGLSNQAAAKYFDTKCTNGELNGDDAPTSADSGTILTSLNDPFPLGLHIRQPQAIPAHGPFINYNQYANNNGFPEPNVQGAAQPLDATRSHEVYLLASTDGTELGGIVRAVIPASQSFTQLDHFAYADPNGYCAKTNRAPTSADYQPLAKFALVKPTGIGSQAIEGWVAEDLYSPNASTKTACDARP